MAVLLNYGFTEPAIAVNSSTKGDEPQAGIDQCHPCIFRPGV
jgi:hypothetical protein